MADGLTERVARDMFKRRVRTPHDPWNTWESAHEDDRQRCLTDARAALAVVADDVDGIAGVLYRHRPADGSRCSCDWRPTSPFGSHADHQAEMVAAHIRGGA